MTMVQNETTDEADSTVSNPSKNGSFFKDLRGEIMLRIAVLRKEMGLVDLSMQMCNSITSEPYNDAIRANALCLKVYHLLNENIKIKFCFFMHYRAYCTRLDQSFQHQRWCIVRPLTYLVVIMLLWRDLEEYT